MSKESKWTPGPWEWWTSNSWRRLRHSDRGVSTDVLYPTVHRDGQTDIDVSEADMALIAAAPDLYEALEQFAILGHGKCVIGKPLAEVALAALAKARGETP